MTLMELDFIFTVKQELFWGGLTSELQRVKKLFTNTIVLNIDLSFRLEN